MNKIVKYTFGGSNQDISKAKHPLQYYYEGQHIRISSTDTQSTGALTNEKGTELIITLPNISINQSNSSIDYNNKKLYYKNSGEIDLQINNELLPITSNNQVIIGHTETRSAIVLFSTDNMGFDCIWKINNILENIYDLELVYVRNLGFSTSSPIQALFNFENENIQKIYWADGLHQIRSLNLTHSSIKNNSELIDVASNSINFVGTINFSQPKITDLFSGGLHTSGRIQYAYNLFRLNSSQTKVSPLSELVSLDKGRNLGGGDVNEVVGSTPVILIDNIDISYDYIRVYAIKYTSLNEIPSISLIEEKEIDSTGKLTFYDDGTIISSLSLEEFLFLGSDPLIPKHIESKDNRLLMASIKNKNFILPENLDCRVYSFPNNSSTTYVYDNITTIAGTNIPTGDKLTVNNSYAVPISHDSINLNYDIYKYKYNSAVLGASGKYFDIEIVQKNVTNSEEYTFLKDREIYRIGIEFYNRLGQTSLPQWMCDYKMPIGNLNNNYNTLKVTLNSSFYTWLNTYQFESEDDKPVGYRILRADRTVNDKTIICQGVLTGMMVSSPRNPGTNSFLSLSEKRLDSEVQTKLPNFLTRTFAEIKPLQANSHLAKMQLNGSSSSVNPITEVQYKSSERKADVYQYTAMQQLYSPDILFSNLSVNLSTKLKVIGGAINNFNAWWGQERLISSKAPEQEGKTLNKLTPHVSGGTNLTLNGNINKMQERGLICNVDGSTPDIKVGHNQFYREFTTYINSSVKPEYNIYGIPELTERGQGRTVYNNNAKYTYSNTLEGFLTDGEDHYTKDSDIDRAVLSVNSYGAKCYTLVLDRGDNEDVAPHTRPLLENLYTDTNIGNTNSLLIAEFIKPTNEIYFSGIYNGISYEDKKRTSYIQIGEYSNINTNFIQIDNAGDTYVQEFRFMRIGKTDVEVYSPGINQHTEIVSVKLETSIDVKNRNDISLNSWDARFQPQYNEFHKYNSVYSQQSVLLKTTDTESTFREISNFDGRIQSTKLKTPNESVDSWTDILVNENMDLNGQYGPINSLVSYEDEIFAFQDTAVAQIKVNPRVQIQGDDGVGIELGTGSVLYDYKYITTNSGSINKWGIKVGKKGMYYYDALNKGIFRFPDYIKVSLTDGKGFHSYFNNNFKFNDLKQDNPILEKGVVFGRDTYNNDMYFTLLQGDKSFTRCFNELSDEFIDLKTYKPSIYIDKGEKFISINSSTGKTIYEHNKGLYNNFYDEYKPSYIILQINPESDHSCIFNSIYYNSELYLNGIDQYDKTLTSIQAYNEYQDSGKIPLILGRDKNLRRKFREWKAQIPRDKRSRIRNPWIFLKLELDNTSNYKLILHDIIVHYTI